MASPSRTAEREEQRRLNMRTLVIASAASAAAALLTSQLWIAGTWIAAAMTPVIVALVSEMLHRPTERIARRVTSERAAVLPEAGGAAPPAREEAPARTDTAARPQPPATPARVYRSGEPGSRPAPAGRRRRKIAYGVVFGTAALAFVIVVVALTATELIAGDSIGKNDSRTTLFSGKKKNDAERDSQAPQDSAPDEGARPEERDQSVPEETAPPEEEPPAEEAPPEATPPGEPLPEETAPVPPVEQP